MFLDIARWHSSLAPMPGLLIVIPFRIGKPVNCYYCPNCTSHVYHHQTVLGPKIVVRTGLLKNSNSFPVGAEIFGKDKLSWQPEIAKTVFPGPPQ